MPRVECAPLDALVAEQVLNALTPAGVQLSLQAAEDIEKERGRLDGHWRQEQERAHYESQRAERRYRAVDPENRLVARTIEKHWEEALRREREIQEPYDRFQRSSPRRLSSEESELIRSLADDIPALWHAADNSPTDRKEIVRCLVDRVTTTIRDETEHVEVTIHWAGGHTSRHDFRRPVQRYEQMADYARMRERVESCHSTGATAAQIAESLNSEGFRPPSARAVKFTERLVWQLMYRMGLAEVRPRSERLASGEWWFRDLASKLGIALSRLRHWVKKGYVHSRKVGRGGHFVVWADNDELDRLKNLCDFPKEGQASSFPGNLVRPKQRPDPHPFKDKSPESRRRRAANR